jgi:capsular exopolysaccharide synthesis family protein
VTLRTYLRVLGERWKLIAVFTIAALAVAVAITALTPKKYQASVQVYVASNISGDAGSSSVNLTNNLYLQAQVATFASLIDASDVMTGVQHDLNLPLSPSDLRGKISATVTTGQAIINIHATDKDPQLAANIANSAARSFVTAIQNYNTVNNAAAPSVRLFITQTANAPSSPQSPKPVINIVLGLLLGLLVGAAIAVARDILDTRIKNADSLAKVAEAPVMGVIVEDAKAQRHPIATRAGARNMRAENYRQLRANLQFANVDQHPRVIAVTSSVPGEGKTTVAINLASTLAEAGFSVCLVDADLRRPTVAKVLGLLSPVGLTSVLIHQIELSEALQNAGSSFYVLTSGPTPPNPSEVLASAYVRDVIRSLLDKVDYVVCDTAPLLPVADGAEVAALSDGTLLVARHGLATDSHIKRATSILSRVDAKLIGVVLNRVPSRRSNEYGYTYYRAETTAPTHSRRGAAARGAGDR